MKTYGTTYLPIGSIKTEDIIDNKNFQQDKQIKERQRYPENFIRKTTQTGDKTSAKSQRPIEITRSKQLMDDFTRNQCKYQDFKIKQNFHKADTSNTPREPPPLSSHTTQILLTIELYYNTNGGLLQKLSKESLLGTQIGSNNESN